MTVKYYLLQRYTAPSFHLCFEITPPCHLVYNQFPFPTKHSNKLVFLTETTVVAALLWLKKMREVKLLIGRHEHLENVNQFDFPDFCRVFLNCRIVCHMFVLCSKYTDDKTIVIVNWLKINAASFKFVPFFFILIFLLLFFRNICH